jgi:cytochrome P450
VLSRLDDVFKVVHDPATYSSAQGVFPSNRDVSGEGFLPMMITMDPPRHGQLRSIVSKAFTPRRIAELESSVLAVVDGLIDALAEGETRDFAAEVAVPLPSAIMAQLLGVPDSARDEFRQLSTHVIKNDSDDEASYQRAMDAAAALYEAFRGYLEDRRRRPTDDLVTALLHAEVDGDRLSEPELLGFCFLLLVAGNETTTNLLTNLAAELGQHPDQARLFGRDPALVPDAVEESLRFEAPVQALSRTLTRDVTLYDRRVPAGARVLVVFGAANRDDREFDRPDVFDVRRRAERHLAFGHGAHYCLGAALARLETRVLFSRMAARLGTWELAEGARRLPSGTVRGYERLPVAAVAASRATPRAQS